MCFSFTTRMNADEISIRIDCAEQMVEKQFRCDDD